MSGRRFTRIVKQSFGPPVRPFRTHLILGFLVTLLAFPENQAGAQEAEPGKSPAPAKWGAYFFNDWPTRTERQKQEFPHGEPIWGWEDDGKLVHTVEWMEKQVELAREAGLSFWSFCWYIPHDRPQTWRGRTGLTHDNHPLNEALRLFLKTKGKKDFGFCLYVANTFPYALKAEDWDELCGIWVDFMKDESYFKADGMPLLIFHTPQNLFDQFGGEEGTKKALDRLREKAKQAGLPGVMVAFGWPWSEPRFTAAGFDAYTGYCWRMFLPIGYARKAPFAELAGKSREIWNNFRNSNLPFIPSLAIGWDNRSRDPEKMPNSPFFWFEEAKPVEIRDHVAELAAWMNENPGVVLKDKVALIYAWNEIGEGSSMIPTKYQGDAIIRAVRAGIDQTKDGDSQNVELYLLDGVSLDVPGSWLLTYGPCSGPLAEASAAATNLYSLPFPNPGKRDITWFRATTPFPKGENFGEIVIAACASPVPPSIEAGSGEQTIDQWAKELQDRLTAQIVSANIAPPEFLPIEQSNIGGKTSVATTYRWNSAIGPLVTRTIHLDIEGRHVEIRLTQLEGKPTGALSGEVKEIEKSVRLRAVR